MTIRYLLDTNAASAILRQREPVCARAASVPLSSLAISSVTAGEMHYGLAKRPQATALAKLVREFLRYTDILPWSDAIAPHYGTLRAALEAKGVTVEVITGATKAKDRLAIRKRFLDVSGNPERMILVAQARTMSISVNELITAQHAIYASMSERRDDWVQSRGRLHRQGQKGSRVTYWNVFVPDSIDQIMLDKHKDRGDLEKALLDHIRGTTQ